MARTVVILVLLAAAFASGYLLRGQGPQNSVQALNTVSNPRGGYLDLLHASPDSSSRTRKMPYLFHGPDPCEKG
jgi:hypothetical protein